MPQGDVAAKRYAQAVFGLAGDAASVDRWLEDLQSLRVLLTEPSALAFFRSTRVELARKYAVIDQALPNAGANARNLAKLLVRKQRTGLIEQIESAFLDRVNVSRGVAEARVTTAVPLTDDGRRAVEDAVRRMTSAQTVQLEEAVDARILGGAVVQVGDHIIDGSVRTRLSNLRRSISGGLG